MISDASSDKEKARLQSGKLLAYWLWYKRDVRADLSKLAERYPNSHQPLTALALIYADLQKHEKVESLYRQAIEVCDDPKETFWLELRLCVAMRLQNRFEAAEEALTEMLTRYKSDKQLSDIYQECSELLLAQDDISGAQDSFEKALDYEPNKNYLRFQTAYRYSEMGKEENALYHYKILCRLDPDDGMAWNNLGVAYDKLEMRTKAIECYKKAAKLNNSLAMANVANRLITEGLIEEAREWIDKGLKCKEVHGNVGRALSSIDEKVKQEKEKEKEILESLRKKVPSEEEIRF